MGRPCREKLDILNGGGFHFPRFQVRLGPSTFAKLIRNAPGPCFFSAI